MTTVIKIKSHGINPEQMKTLKINHSLLDVQLSDNQTESIE